VRFKKKYHFNFLGRNLLLGEIGFFRLDATEFLANILTCERQKKQSIFLLDTFVDFRLREQRSDFGNDKVEQPRGEIFFIEILSASLF